MRGTPIYGNSQIYNILQWWHDDHISWSTSWPTLKYFPSEHALRAVNAKERRALPVLQAVSPQKDGLLQSKSIPNGICLAQNSPTMQRLRFSWVLLGLHHINIPRIIPKRIHLQREHHKHPPKNPPRRRNPNSGEAWLLRMYLVWGGPTIFPLGP